MSEWNTRSLSELVSFHKGRRVETSPFQERGYQEYLGAGALSGTSDGYADTALAVLATENDVLMLWDGERSGLCGTGLSGVVSSTVAKLSPNGLVNSTLLYYFLSENFEWIQNRRTGTGVPHVPKDIGRILRLKYPKEREEQEAIVTILKSIDGAIEQTALLVKKYQQIKIGLMRDLFTRGIDTHGGLRPVREQAPDLYQESPIGWVPKGWKYVRLDSLFAVESGITLGAHRRPRNTPKPYLRVANVFKEEIRLNDVAYMEATQAEALRYGLRLNDLLLVEGHANIDEIGRCAIVGEDVEGLLFQNHLFRLIANGVEPRFGMYYLNSHFSRRYWKGKCSTSSGLNTINRKMLGAMGFLVPDRTEQERIVAALDAARLRLEHEKLMLEKYSKKRSGLMNDLLTGKVSINIEPAPTEFKHV